MEIKQGMNKFYIEDEEKNLLAEITFKSDGDRKIIVDHTYVSEDLKGQGIGGKLVKCIVDYALREELKIVPICTFAKKLMMNNEDYQKCLSHD